MVTLNNFLNLVGTIGELGEEQIFTFDGTIGDRILFDSLDTYSPFENIVYRVVRSNGEDDLGSNSNLQVTLSFDGENSSVFSNVNSDYFTYIVRHSDGSTDTETVNMTVEPVNDNPESLKKIRGKNHYFSFLLFSFSTFCCKLKLILEKLFFAFITLSK